MKVKFSFVLALVAVGAGSPAFAARKYGMAGCGLGSAVFGPNGGQISAATTNSSSGTQLFGITTGTSNCTPDAQELALLKQESFVVANYATLTKEMAHGEGGSIVGLAETMGCNASVVPNFGRFVQSKYSEIVAAPGTMAMLDTIKSHMASEAVLARSCSLSQIF